MRKIDSNVIMLVLLAVVGIYVVLSQIILLPISNTGMVLTVALLFFIIVIIHGWKTLGVRELLIFLLIAYCIPLLYEYTDGLGFGGLVQCICSYSNLLGPKFLGKVPYVIPLVWSIFLYTTFTMTNIIFHRIRITQRWGEVGSLRWFFTIVGMGIVMGFIMASLDLILDPVMVAMGAWSWSVQGPYYGIPLWNFEGWIEISAVTFVCYNAYLLIRKKSQMYVQGEKRSRYTLMVVVLYLTFLVIYGIYAVMQQVTDVIPWAVMAMGFFSAITIIQFYRSKVKGGTVVSSSDGGLV